jgi:hypothetical protein
MMHRLKFNVHVEQGKDILLGCECHLVIIGKIKPNKCPMFLKACTPEKPVGACMVSSEGTCRVWAKNVAVQGLADSWHWIADRSCNYSFAANLSMHRNAFEFGCGFPDYLRVFTFFGVLQKV